MPGHDLVIESFRSFFGRQQLRYQRSQGGIVTLTCFTAKYSQTIMTEACNFNGLANA
jgi:hypothetical protein